MALHDTMVLLPGDEPTLLDQVVWWGQWELRVLESQQEESLYPWFHNERVRQRRWNKTCRRHAADTGSQLPDDALAQVATALLANQWADSASFLSSTATRSTPTWMKPVKTRSRRSPRGSERRSWAATTSGSATSPA